MNLHCFGLQGVRKPSYYEANPQAMEASDQRFLLRSKLLERSPNLALLVSSDPENEGQAVAKMEVLAILESAMEMGGLAWK